MERLLEEALRAIVKAAYRYCRPEDVDCGWREWLGLAGVGLALVVGCWLLIARLRRD